MHVIHHDNSTLRLCVTEYQCLKTEVRVLRAESHAVMERVAHQSGDARGMYSHIPNSSIGRNNSIGWKTTKM